MRTYLLLAFSLLTLSLSAQFGAASYYNLNQTRTNTVLPEEVLNFGELDNGTEFAAHYWFRLQNKRIEFLPTLYYAAAESPVTGESFSEYGFQFKSNFYLFDFGGDCDCPTFGKQGPALQKGFFLQLSPGYARYAFTPFSGAEREGRGGFTLGGGVGLDIGISNLITLTPFAGVRYGFSPYGFAQLTDVNGQSIGVDEARLTTVQFGLSATFRLDEKRY